MKKKIVSMLLVAAMVLTMVGCGGGVLTTLHPRAVPKAELREKVK